jgi:amino acid transporter
MAVIAHTKKGFLIAAIVIAINVVGQLTHLINNSWFSYISLIVFMIAILIAVVQYNTQIQQPSNFSILLTHGFKTTAVATVILFMYGLMAYYFIFTNYIDALLNKGIEEAQKQGKTAQEIKSNLVIARKVIIISLLAGTVMLHLLSGGIGALIAAVFSKKVKNN